MIFIDEPTKKTRFWPPRSLRRQQHTYRRMFLTGQSRLLWYRLYGGEANNRALLVRQKSIWRAFNLAALAGSDGSGILSLFVSTPLRATCRIRSVQRSARFPSTTRR
jgi:hypothetical protein